MSDLEELPLEPILFDPVYKEKIWGGQALADKLGKNIPYDKKIGESWEISGYGSDQTIVCAGELAGKPLGELYSSFRHELAGSAGNSPVFPLLFKYIDANDKLSVQVHPDDEQARASQWGNFGKTECWYIADAREDAQIIVGFKEQVTTHEVRQAVENNTLGDLLNYIRVAPGDVFFIPAGTVHAILDGTLIYEVQESSDTTLRLYDWGRTDSLGNPRELHVKDAIDVLDTTCHHRHRIEPVVFDENGYKHAYRVACRYFALEQYAYLRETDITLPAKKSFQVISVVGGQLILTCGKHVTIMPQGCTALLPAGLPPVSASGFGGTRYLVSYVPDLRTEIIEPLQKYGVSSEMIALLGGNETTNDLIALLG